jgi:protein-disulfide isomerase
VLDVEPLLLAEVAEGRLAIVSRQLVQLGERSALLAEAAACAADQGLYWEMRAAIYRQAGRLFADGQATATAAAEEAGVELTAWQACLDAGAYRAAVQADAEAAQAAGVVSRPVLEFNGRRLIGQQSITAIDGLLAGE